MPVFSEIILHAGVEQTSLPHGFFVIRRLLTGVHPRPRRCGTVPRKRMEDQSCGFVVGGHDGCFLIIDLVDVDLALRSI